MYRIKEILVEKGIKSKELAERLGKSKQYISNIINESGNVSVPMLSEIASALNVPIYSLFDDYKPELKSSADIPTITCPHCGQKIELEAKAVEKGGTGESA